MVGSLSSESEKEEDEKEEKEVVEPYCRRCMERMEQAVREEYEILRARVREEGLRMKWPGLELVRALDALGRAEEEERRTLRDQCGL